MEWKLCFPILGIEFNFLSLCFLFPTFSPILLYLKVWIFALFEHLFVIDDTFPYDGRYWMGKNEWQERKKDRKRKNWGEREKIERERKNWGERVGETKRNPLLHDTFIWTEENVDRMWYKLIKWGKSLLANLFSRSLALPSQVSINTNVSTLPWLCQQWWL